MPAIKWTPKTRRQLNAWMAHLGVSQREMARRLTQNGEKITAAALGHLIRGKTASPRKPTPVEAATALGIDHAALEAGPPKAADAQQARTQLSAHARGAPGALAEWNRWRAACLARGEWHGRPPAAVQAYARSLDVPLPFWIHNTLANAHVIRLGLLKLRADKSLSEATRRDAALQIQQIESIVSLAMDTKQGIDESAPSDERLQQYHEHQGEVRALFDELEQARLDLEGEPAA